MDRPCGSGRDDNRRGGDGVVQRGECDFFPRGSDGNEDRDRGDHGESPLFGGLEDSWADGIKTRWNTGEDGKIRR